MQRSVYTDLWSIPINTSGVPSASRVSANTNGATGPTNTSGTPAVYNPDTNELVFFGGASYSRGNADAYFDLVWSFNLTSLQWVLRQPNGTWANGGPLPRFLENFVFYRAPNGRAYGLLEGGSGSAFYGNGQDTDLADLWLLDLRAWNWTALTASGGVTAADGARLVLVPGLNKAFRFGGFICWVRFYYVPCVFLSRLGFVLWPLNPPLLSLIVPRGTHVCRPSECTRQRHQHGPLLRHRLFH